MEVEEGLGNVGNGWCGEVEMGWGWGRKEGGMNGRLRKRSQRPLTKHQSLKTIRSGATRLETSPLQSKNGFPGLTAAKLINFQATAKLHARQDHIS